MYKMQLRTLTVNPTQEPMLAEQAAIHAAISPAASKSSYNQRLASYSYPLRTSEHPSEGEGGGGEGGGGNGGGEGESGGRPDGGGGGCEGGVPRAASGSKAEQYTPLGPDKSVGYLHRCRYVTYRVLHQQPFVAWLFRGSEGRPPMKPLHEALKYGAP